MLLEQLKSILGDRLHFLPIEALWAKAGRQCWGYTDGHSIWVAVELPLEPHPKYPSKLHVVLHEIAHVAYAKGLLTWTPKLEPYKARLSRGQLLGSSSPELEALCDCWAQWAIEHPAQVAHRVQRII
jgi:hypothetical protein